MKFGDKIIKINDEKIRLKSDISSALYGSDGSEVKVVVERNGEELEFNVKPTEYEENTYILGIQVALIDATWKEKLYYGFWETVNFVESMFESVKLLFTGNIKIDQMTGPIGISEIVVKSDGIYNFIYLLCLISLSLGVTNLLPIPALDGGRIVLLIIEGIRGKALKEEIELGIQSAGFLLLILLSLYVSYKDILRIF
ncbi:MAG: site-2 protease family protein [Clostridia bacterium]|nr:site-2 protease family protein [Clostridia bacterium]